MVRKILSIVLFILTGASPVFSIGFEKIWAGVLLSTDQEGFIDLIVNGNQAFLLKSYWSAHQGISGVRIVKINLKIVPHNLTEWFNYPLPFSRTYIPIMELSYMWDIQLIEPEKVLQNRLYLINDIIHAPDKAGYSHKITLSGKYLGRFPGFEEEYRQFRLSLGRPLLEWDGQPILTPLSIEGTTYDTFVELDSALLLVADNKVTMVGIQDFINQQEKASQASVPKERNSFVTPVKHNFFLLEKNLYLAKPGEAIVKVPLNAYPDAPSSNWSFVQGNSYYQMEGVILTKYNMEGIGGLSNVEHGTWQELN